MAKNTAEIYIKIPDGTVERVERIGAALDVLAQEGVLEDEERAKIVQRFAAQIASTAIIT